MIAMRIHQFGPPTVVQQDRLSLPEPGADQVRIRYEAIGVNFHDCYTRSGLYQVALPHTLGVEGGGTVDAVGPNVEDVKVGDRVACALAGSTYAEYGIAEAARVVPLPADLPVDLAAAVLLQGLTAHYLTHSTFPLQGGHRILVHAAAGGVGLLLVQIAKRIGATVFATVGSKVKADVALAAGADAAIVYTETDFVTELNRLTSGSGVDVVYDSVGQSTFSGSLRCLAQRGLLVSFGQSSGAVEPVAPLELMFRSLYVTRPHLRDYIRTGAELRGRTADVFGWLTAGQLKVKIDGRYPLTHAAEAHRRLESRQSTGKVLLVP